MKEWSKKALKRREVDISQTLVAKVVPVESPQGVKARLPLADTHRQRICRHRDAVREVLHRRDDRLLVIVGPCSIHDSDAALEYAARLSALNAELNDRLLIVMRCYFEKPRTTTGWKGLLHDPLLDDSNDMMQGVKVCRRLLLRITEEYGLPVATEALNPLAIRYLEDLLTWIAVGARTTESQIHREMVSGLGVPTGFKNATTGNLEIALHAMLSAAAPHAFLGVDDAGQMGSVHTSGNPDTHIVLRGGKCSEGRSFSNYDALSIARCEHAHASAGFRPAIVVDCSHENSGKDHRKQPEAALSVVQQRQQGTGSLRGIMLESFLEEGNQKHCSRSAPKSGLTYGQSITDACLGWKATEVLLRSMYRQLQSGLTCNK